MIGYLNGIVKSIRGDSLILDVNGVGYRISTRGNFSIGDSAEFFIHTQVSSDSIRLFGFSTEDEFDLFEILISVSGIGAKTAQNILASISFDELSRAVHEKDSAAISRLPGIGKKSAERLILELQDKLPRSISNSNIDVRNRIEASEALQSLGYSQTEIDQVFKDAPANSSTENLIKLALQKLNRF